MPVEKDVHWVAENIVPCAVVHSLSSLIASDEMIRVRLQRKRTEQRKERQRHKQLSWFLPQHGSSPVPLALPRRFHYNHKDYNCSILSKCSPLKNKLQIHSHLECTNSAGMAVVLSCRVDRKQSSGEALQLQEQFSSDAQNFFFFPLFFQDLLK
ncbi:hypothetical protein MTR_0386s0030 [Medicago truncatula]|uniref:Uncharacterized protein n=1 Tax=Medicago truncatula TaxID=3880 RepID=A0A072TG93_MEDTR|nr:hypothetical protein MTR_0386s0030 [Medicago truncatula]